MSVIHIELPEALHEEIQKLARRENVSVDRIVALAVAEKIAALDTDGYLRGRAARAEISGFEQAMTKIPDVPCPEEDTL